MQIIPELLDYYVDYPHHWTGLEFFQSDFYLIIRLHVNVGNVSGK